MMPGAIMFEAASATLAAVDLGAKADPASLLPIVPNGATAVVMVVAMAAGLINIVQESWFYTDRASFLTRKRINADIAAEWRLQLVPAR